MVCFYCVCACFKKSFIPGYNSHRADGQQFISPVLISDAVRKGKWTSLLTARFCCGEGVAEHDWWLFWWILRINSPLLGDFKQILLKMTILYHYIFYINFLLQNFSFTEFSCKYPVKEQKLPHAWIFVGELASATFLHDQVESATNADCRLMCRRFSLITCPCTDE